MKDRIHRHLDGELPEDELQPTDREHVDEWARMVDAFRTAEPEMTGSPPWLEQRVMAEIDALATASPIARLADWIVSPKQIRVSPLAAGLVAAALSAVIALPGREVPGDGTGPSGSGASVQTTAEAVVYVQFIMEAPGAQSVAVAGDFSEWEPTFALDDADGDGVWTGRVPVRPGVHSYMFLIDGAEWQTDPNADSYQDDGFGNQNAVLAIASGE
ncbi:MAG: hypothetical protein ACKVIN_10880 [Longimicrobiales bacterium]